MPSPAIESAWPRITDYALVECTTPAMPPRPLVSGVASVFTYDVDDWVVFEADGLRVAGPPSTLTRMGR